MTWIGLGWVLAGTARAGDKDGDGVKGKLDQCEDRAEDADGWQDDDGCPEADNDGDGREDADDQCANEAEDKDGWQDGDGCPDPDDDGDGVPDDSDACRREADDGDDRDGCPTVTLKLLTETGWMAEVGGLANDLLGALGQQESGCDSAASAAQRWLADNDPHALQADWDARMARAPEGFDAAAATELLAQKGEIYRNLKPALDVYCKSHGGWSAVEAGVDAVFGALPPPAPKKKGRR